MIRTLRSPLSGAELEADTPHSLTDGHTRWPVVDGIPFLRAERDALRADALTCLDRGDRTGALVLLLGDQDDWWRGPRAKSNDLRELVRERDQLSLREAMALLAWGPVADYFAHRWSDPTFLAGLALVQAHWSEPRDCFELACGIGHHLRALGQCGARCTGADIVFAKLWIARNYAAREADLVCFDAAHLWPIDGARYKLVACHDAFYFLEPKQDVARRLRAAMAHDGWLAISHVHNREWPNLSAGRAVTRRELATLFPDSVIYDDAELTRALVERRTPSPGAGNRVEAFSLAVGPGLRSAQAASGVLTVPSHRAMLKRNPLYDACGVIRWPSERYAAEYGPRATYAPSTTCPETAPCDAATLDWALRRELVDLPERW